MLVVASTASTFSRAASTQGSENTSATLLEKHAVLKSRLAKNQYGRPLFLESEETEKTVSSIVYAVLESPFSTVSATFKSPDRWCEVLILHLNTKNCHSKSDAANSTRLAVNIGKKIAQPLSETFLLDFSYRVTAVTPDYLAVNLHADKGPLNTTDYQIELQAIPLPEGRTFINLRYSYGYGLAGRLAMQAYLSTLGRGKIGFTKNDANGGPAYVSGMRGAVERNTMRYYLAIESYLVSLKQSPSERFDSSIKYWFSATEEYSQQLREVDRQSYIAMKNDEYQRQKSFRSTSP